MKVTRNQLAAHQKKPLLQSIRKFHKESQMGLKGFDEKTFVSATLNNMAGAISRQTMQDFWLSEDGRSYCLCRYERDSDYEIIYTAYQLYLDPSIRSWATIRRWLRFLKFYAKRAGCSRLLLWSSRLDAIKAYQRGIGKEFEIVGVIFSRKI